MKCTDINIKNLLPAYLEQQLNPTERGLIENHLASCRDCRVELSLLRMMAEEAVPDPGVAFWDAIPGRVYHAVQRQKTAKKSSVLARLFDWMDLPRWGWTAATASIILILSWFIISPEPKGPEVARLYMYEFTDDRGNTQSVSLSELDNRELSTINTWAGNELSSIAREADEVVRSGHDTDLDEELGYLNEREVEQLSKMLEQIRREG
jgi:hypothetical protein